MGLAGRTVSGAFTGVESLNLKVIYFQPTLSYRVSHKISIGVLY